MNQKQRDLLKSMGPYTTRHFGLGGKVSEEWKDAACAAIKEALKPSKREKKLEEFILRLWREVDAMHGHPTSKEMMSDTLVNLQRDLKITVVGLPTDRSY